MKKFDNIDMLAFNLKMMSHKSKKNVLISAGKLEDKEKLLSAFAELSRLSVSLFATAGTHNFLHQNQVHSEEIYKIAEGNEPNIKSFLTSSRFDLIINILTGDNDYDESSDSKLIRSLAIEKGIPLITDVDIAILTIQDMVKKHDDPTLLTEDSGEPWNLHRHFLELVGGFGGYACYHAHFDKAYLISPQNLQLSMVDMQKKWDLYKYLKENYTHQDLVGRISRGVEGMIAQGVTYCRTHLDADSTVKLLPIQAAIEVRERYKDKIRLEFGVQPLQGVLEAESRKYFVEACELADFVGGLPSKDRPTPEKHLDFIMDLARDLNKPLDVHIDQENNPFENETELLAVKTMEHGLEGRVSGVHAISIAAKPEAEQDRVLKLVKDAGVAVIICPSAALSMKQLTLNAPIHNSIAPLRRLLDLQIPVRLGVDNVADLFMPIVDGDMWFECRALMESCRFYDLNKVAEIACDKSGASSSIIEKI